MVDTADTQATPVAADEAAVAVHDAAITPDGGMSDLTISGLPSDFALTENEGDQPPVTSDTISLAYSEFADHGLHGSGKDHNTAAERCDHEFGGGPRPRPRLPYP